MSRPPGSDGEVMAVKVLGYIGLILSVAIVVNIVAVARAPRETPGRIDKAINLIKPGQGSQR